MNWKVDGQNMDKTIICLDFHANPNTTFTLKNNCSRKKNEIGFIAPLCDLDILTALQKRYTLVQIKRAVHPAGLSLTTLPGRTLPPSLVSSQNSVRSFNTSDD